MSPQPARTTPGPSGHGTDADENTPLLVAEEPVPTANQETAKTVSSVTTSAVTGEASRNGDDKPLPVAQVLILCFARLIEPVAFFSIFPYINKMVKENGNLAVVDVGFYGGLIESLFSLTQMFLMILWGKASDRFGRKPVLVFSLVGVTFSTGLFGMAKTIPQMIFLRCLAGVFAGTIVTIRTMLSEHSTSKTQARSFSWFAFTGNLGILLGQLLGGALAEPAELYPSLFGRVQFFVDYPYALPSLAVGAIGILAVTTVALFAEETLVRENPAAGGDGEESGGVAKPAPLTTWELIKSPGVPIVLYTYGHVMLLAFSYTAIVPLFFFTTVELGGLGFTPLVISLFMGITGISQAIWVLVVFPPLQHRIGTNGVMRACATAYPIFFFLEPFFNFFLRRGYTTVFWASAPVAMALGCGVSMSFTAIQLALNDVSPSPAVLGTLNAVALSLVMAVRAASPAAFASLYAIGARTQWLWGYAIWVLMVALAAGFTVVSRYLPDYEELKKQRERDQEWERAEAERAS